MHKLFENHPENAFQARRDFFHALKPMENMRRPEEAAHHILYGLFEAVQIGVENGVSRDEAHKYWNRAVEIWPTAEVNSMDPAMKHDLVSQLRELTSLALAELVPDEVREYMKHEAELARV